jgi:nucleoside-diphosphate-sugar epimerase
MAIDFPGNGTMNLFCFGLGYAAETLIREHGHRFQSISGTVRTLDKAKRLRAAGINAIVYAGGEAGPLLEAALSDSTCLLVSAAPDGAGDPMLRQLGHVLKSATKLETIIYLSTVGVYGNHDGAWIDENTPLNAQSERGKARVAAEAAWLAFGKENGVAVQLHRLAGIYGPGRNVLEELKAGTARRIIKADQVFNRIHVRDIAGAAMAGFENPKTVGAFNICDTLPSPPQDVVAFGAELLGMQPPPEIPFTEAKLSEMGRSFYSECKRCSNRRLMEVLGYTMLYPTYREGLQGLASMSNPRE